MACFRSLWRSIFSADINTHNLYWHGQNISNYTSLQGSSSKRDLCLCARVCVCLCVRETVHACVTSCVGGCTCVYIKKYQLFWSVAHHSSHSPLSCTHLTRPQEKKGKSATDGEAAEQDKDRLSKRRKKSRRGGWKGRCICHQRLW